jgi:hypothetical protein
MEKSSYQKKTLNSEYNEVDWARIIFNNFKFGLGAKLQTQYIADYG